MTTAAEVQTAAELERLRLAQQAARARAQAGAQARQAETQTEAQAREAISETERQAQVARSEVRREAESRQAEIRKQRGQAEREAETAKAQARQAQRIEQRKVVLPVSKPRDLGLTSYVANVETARKQAHQAGESAKVAVAKVRDDYFKEVDKARDDAIADIAKQKAGIISDIQRQLVNINADLTKQLASVNSGVAEWERDSQAKIAKAQADYEAAIEATLNRSGTEVFADMKGKGLIPPNAVYNSYDKATGQLNYTVPDTRSGTEIFTDLQGQNKIPPNAKYESYDAGTGQVSYKVETPNFGSSIFKRMQNAGTIPKNATFIKYDAKDRTVSYFVANAGATTIPETTGISPVPDSTVTTTPSSSTVGSSQKNTNVVGAAAGTAAMAGLAITFEAGVGIAAIPTPPTWVIGGLVIIGAGIATYFTAKKVSSDLQKKQNVTEQQAADAVVTNEDGTVAYSIQQIMTTPQAKGGSILTDPWTKPLPADIKDYFPDINPLELKNIIEQQPRELPGIPISQPQSVLILRDPWTTDPLNKGKMQNVLTAAIATGQAETNLARMAVKERVLTREQYERLQDLQGLMGAKERVITGEEYRKLEALREKYLEPGAGISQSYRLAYEDYLRKKAILEAARKSYVASVNPQPVKGVGSAETTAAAVGIWFVSDVLRDKLATAAQSGESVKSALESAQTEIKQSAKQLGLTQQQISTATYVVIREVTIQAMVSEAVKAASQAQAQNLTATQIQTQTLAATKTVARTAVQSAVQTQTLTLAQAAELARELDLVAEAVATTTAKKKLPKPKGKVEEEEKKYPDGTIVWKMGETKRGEEYKIIPPPYTMLKPISSRYPPKGMTKTKGTPQETLTFIGGKVPFGNVSFDLGVTDGFIDVKARKIEFTGGGQKTDVGTRIVSTTKGVSLANNKILRGQLTRPRIESVSAKPHRGRLVSHGVYADKGSRRITRKRRRGWKRIY